MDLDKGELGKKWGGSSSPLQALTLLGMNPPPLPGSDGITIFPYGNYDNFCLAILICYGANERYSLQTI